MLLRGLNHVAILTNDTERLHAFYREVFDAEVLRDGAELPDGGGPRLSIIKIGEWSEINVFQIEGNTEADHQTPMFGRGRIDHLALQADSLAAFETIRDWTPGLGRPPITITPTDHRPGSLMRVYMIKDKKFTQVAEVDLKKRWPDKWEKEWLGW